MSDFNYQQYLEKITANDKSENSSGGKTIFKKGVIYDPEKDKFIRRKIKEHAIELFKKIVASENDKQKFNKIFAEFKEFYNNTYCFENLSINAFDNLRKANYRELVTNAYKVIEKFSK